MKKFIAFLSVVMMGLCLVLAPVTSAVEEVLAVKTAKPTNMPTPLPLIVLGGEVSFADTSSGDLILAGGDLSMSGEVNKNLYVLGGKINVSGKTLGNVIVLGGDVTFAEESMINGYLVSAGGVTKMNGKVNGDVRVFSGEFSTGDKAVFGGKLIADSGKISTSDKTKFEGEKRLEETSTNRRMPWGYMSGMMARQDDDRGLNKSRWIREIVGLIGKVVFMLIFVRLFGSHLIETYKSVKRSLWKLVGTGALKVLLTPAVILLLLVSIIGIPLAGLVGAVYLTAMFLSFYISSSVLGHWLSVKGWLKTKNLYYQAIAGLLSLELIGIVPVLGGLVKFFALLVGMGVIWMLEMKLFVAKKE